MPRTPLDLAPRLHELILLEEPMADKPTHLSPKPTRRAFLQATALGAGGALASTLVSGEGVTPQLGRGGAKPPNFLFLISDQLGLDALSAYGCPDVHTPNLDRLVKRGVSFMLSHSTNPVCSPARSSLFTGRMDVETGVITNSRPIHESVPNMGQWLGQAGYEPVYCGKWHLPGGQPTGNEGFTVLPVGGQGDIGDPLISRTCEAYLKSRAHDKPFLLVASFLQPHDICYWAIRGKQLVPAQLPFPQLADQLPQLPPNHAILPPAPAKLAAATYRGFSDEQWRYYIWIYYRQVEMLDADVGRLLDALDESGEADNTIIVFTSDHGEGRGRHLHVQKWYPYDEGALVPMIIACPGRLLANLRDAQHLVSGLDVMSTMCDYAGIQPPADVRGRSLRPLLEGKQTEWREFVVVDTQIIGRTARTADYKYIRYQDDPVDMLFDMKRDPWETKNLYQEAKYADTIKEHRKLLDQWEAHLKPVAPTPDYEALANQRRRR